MAEQRLAQRQGELIDRSQEVTFQWEGRASHRLRRRHHRLGPLRRRHARVLALLQVPPPARPDVLLGPVPELPGRGGRAADRARLHDAGRAGHGREAPERVALAAARLPAPGGPAHAQLRHAGRLLLQDLHPPAPGLAALREDPAQRRRPGQARSRPPPHRALRQGAPPRRRAGDRRRRGRAGGGRRGGRAGQARGAGRGGPCSGRTAGLGRAAQQRTPDGADRPGERGRRRDPAARVRRRRLRGAAGAGLPGPHDAPLPPSRAGDRHRLDRAAAGVRQQRPAGRDAGQRSADGWSTSSG